MRKLIIIAATAILSTSELFAASPAATQKWVQDYTAAHSGVSMEWVIDYVRTNRAYSEISPAASSNTASGVVSRFKTAAITSSLGRTNDVYRSSSSVTNLDSLVLAKLRDDFYTNALASVYMTMTGGVFDLHDGAVSYVSGTNLADSVISLVCETNGVVSIFASKANDTEVSKAKGK